jgi:hypothetical protein
VTPKTLKEALKLWDAGEPVPAFRVESKGAATQDQLWGAAFALLTGSERDRGALLFNNAAQESFQKFCKDHAFTKRDQDVAHSIAHVASSCAWDSMLEDYVHNLSSPAITVCKGSL